MIDTLVDEIKCCIANKCYMTALMTALTLPDICGKAKYPNEKTGSRYKMWYEEYVGKYDAEEEYQKLGIPYLSSKIIYSLRNALIYQGNPNIDNENFNINNFNLVKSNANFDISSNVQNLINETTGDISTLSVELKINIKKLCMKICKATQLYYSNNKEKFDFIKYNILEW